MDRKLKGIPVYAIVLILVSGTALGAGIWFLTVDVPVEYHEPMQVTFRDERDGTDETYTEVRSFEEHTIGADLTYENFYQYVDYENPADGKDPVEIRTYLQAYDDQDPAQETQEIGFVLIDDVAEDVDPQDVTWGYDANDDPQQATYDGTDYDVIYGSTDFDLTVNQDESDSITLIYTQVTDENGDPIDVDGYEIEWQFEDITDTD